MAFIIGAVAAAAITAGTQAYSGQEQQHAAKAAASGLLPYQYAGSAALSKLYPLLGLGAGGPGSETSTLESLPGYNFSMTQGLKAEQNMQGARGLGVSGAAEKGAANYATGLAQSNWMNYVNPLMAMAGLGQNAAAGVGNYGIGGANAMAGGITGAGNSLAGGANSAALLSSPYFQAMLKAPPGQGPNNMAGPYTTSSGAPLDPSMVDTSIQNPASGGFGGNTGYFGTTG